MFANSLSKRKKYAADRRNLFHVQAKQWKGYTITQPIAGILSTRIPATTRKNCLTSSTKSSESSTLVCWVERMNDILNGSNGSMSYSYFTFMEKQNVGLNLADVQTRGLFHLIPPEQRNKLPIQADIPSNIELIYVFYNWEWGFYIPSHLLFCGLICDKHDIYQLKPYEFQH